MSARDWRAVREGETHAASRTSNTPESFIVGVGASGGLLAGAAIVFVTLVGVVSFNAWPSTAGISSRGGNVELSAATPPPGSDGAAAPLSSATGQLASATPPAGGSGDGGAGGAGGADGGGKRDRGSAGGQLGSGSPPSTSPATPPASDVNSDEGPQPGRGEPIGGVGSDEAPSGRSIREQLPVNAAGQSEGSNNGKGDGHDNGNGKGRPAPAGKGPVAAPALPPAGSNEEWCSDDDDNCRGNNRSRGRESDRGESSSRSSSRSSRGSSESPGRGKGRGRSGD